MDRNELQEMISNYTDDTQQDTVEASWTDVRRTAAVIRASKGFVQLPTEQLPDGGLRLRAKVTDAFCFVDHPQVELDSSGEKVSSFYCDCPDFRMDGRFCAHCAALLEERPKATLCHSMKMSEDNAAEEDIYEDNNAEFLDTTEGEEPQLMDLSYKYCNSRYDLYPMQKEPRIPLERYILMFGDNARARKLYDREEKWGGNCFGFTSSAAIFYRNELEPTIVDFNPNARIPSELSLKDQCQKLNLSVLGFIEAMQISQYNGMWYDLSINELAAATEAFQKGEGMPISMGIQRKSGGGHSIFPFRLERTQEQEDILYIYDPNNPLKTQQAYLQKDETGNYVHWRYPVTYGKPYDSRYGAILDHAPYQRFADAWQNRGGRTNKNLLLLQSGVSLLNGAGEPMARITHEGVEIFSKDIKQIIIKSGNAAENVILEVPMGALQIVAEDPALEELCVQLIGTDLSVDVSTEAKRVAVFVDDQQKRAYAQIPQEHVRYILQILSSLDEKVEETLLTGITQAESMSLMQDYGQLYGSGINEEAMLYVDQVQKELSSIGQLAPEEETQQERQQIRNEATENPEDDQV